MTDAERFAAGAHACDIVVPAYNAFEALERCLQALERVIVDFAGNGRGGVVLYARGTTRVWFPGRPSDSTSKGAAAIRGPGARAR
jgi:hypothetical protein